MATESPYVRCRCGGKNGVAMTIITRSTEFRTWGDDGIDTEGHTILRTSNLRCADCGARVKRLPQNGGAG